MREPTANLRQFVAAVLFMSASATSTAASESNVLSEVVVTAERRETQLQTTPVAVTAMGSSELDRLQVADIRDMGASAPSLAIEPNLASTSAITVSMRGNAEQNAAFLFSEPGVGLYVDGVYRRLTGAAFDLMDVERVEVLRGPQGTLFGRNTLAGAMNVITHRPDQTVRGNVELSYGSFDTTRVRASLSGPLADNWSGGIAAIYRDRSGGWMHNMLTGEDVGSGKYQGAQAELRYTQGNFDADLRLFTAKNSTDGAYASPVAVSTLKPVYADLTDVAAAGVTYQGSKVNPFSENKQSEADLVLTWSLDNMTVKSVTAYFDMPTDDWAVDFTAAQMAGGTGVAGGSGFFRWSAGDQKQFSEDLTLTGQAGGFDWTAGLYYYSEKTNQTIRDFFAGGLFAAVPAVHHLDAHSFAGYAQVRYAFSDAFSGILGGRYTQDSKDFSGNKASAAGAPTNFASSKDYSKFTGKAGLEYKVSERVFTYLTFSQGFKSGQYDFFASAPLIAVPLDPEIVDSVELGIKSELLDRTLRINLAIFDTKYKDLVVGTIVPNVGLNNKNAGTEKVTGVEGEITWRATEGLTLYGTFSLLDPRWTELTAEALATGVKIDDIPPLAFKHQGSAGATYTVPAGSGSLTMNLNGTFLGEQYQQVAHLYRESMRVAPHNWVNASISYNNGPHTLTFSGKNLSDNTNRVIASDFSTFLFNNTTAWYPAESRSWELVYRYDVR